MSHTRQLILILLLTGGLPGPTQAQVQTPAVTLSLPLIDMPFNKSDGYTFPSMQQSLSLSKGFYDYTHHRIVQSYTNQPTREFLVTVGLDVLSLWLPLGSGWLHEEWHRAVMSQHGIDSYNEIYDFNLFSETVAVSHVSDADLIRLKQLYPADLVRLHAAGMEAQNELNRAIEQDLFFKGRQSIVDAVLWLNNLNNTEYIYTCATNDSNRLTQDMFNSEGSDISRRDFTGLDCDAWVYDLFRPNEPYTARGIHPSGVGIKRYIAYQDLSDAEKDYLHKQIGLSLLNLINPFLYHHDHFNGINPFSREPLIWNAALRHYLASFGFVVDVNLLARQKQHRVMLTIHNYFNHHHYFPGLSLSVLQQPVTIFGKRLWLAPQADIWLQPTHQQFETGESELGGRISLELSHPINTRLESYITVDTKTDGWVAGNVYLGDNVSVRLGLKAHLN